MKNVFRLLSVSVIILLSSCRNSNNTSKKTSVHQSKNSVDTIPYFSLSGFIESEIQDVDKTPYYIYQVSLINDKKDSSALSKEAFNEMAREFVTKDISASGIKEKYREDIFRDLSTQSVTLNYAAMDSSLEVQSIDVLLDEASGKVKRVFIRAMQNKKDTSIVTQYNWKAGKSFLINRSLVSKNGKSITEQHYVNWNDNNR
jgi:hypothetical protein